MSFAQDAQVILDDVTQSTQTKFMGIATITVLLWDHVDTFPTEVEFIWQRPKTTVSYLFLLNRYLTPLGFGVNIFAYFSEVWTPKLCSDFIRFEGSMTLIGVNVVAFMMLLRIRILYHLQPWVVRFVALVLGVQFTMNAYLLTRGQAVEHHPLSGIKSCTMIFDPSISIAASTSAWLPLLYDSIVFGLTVSKTWRSIPWNRKRKRSVYSTTTFITRQLLSDGILYFSVIMSVTMVLTLMIIFAPPGIKNITAQLQLIITVTMMSRITLRLKSNRGKDVDSSVQYHSAGNMSQQQDPMSSTRAVLSFRTDSNPGRTPPVRVPPPPISLPARNPGAWSPPQEWAPRSTSLTAMGTVTGHHIAT